MSDRVLDEMIIHLGDRKRLTVYVLMKGTITEHWEVALGHG